MIAARTLLAALLFLASASAWPEGMQPGRWEIVTTITSPAMPGVPPTTKLQCFGPEQEWDPASMLQPGQGHPDCTLTITSPAHYDFRWNMECPQSRMRGSGKMRYGGTSMEGEMRTSTEIGGQSFDTTQKVSGRRIGPCAQ